MFKEILIDLLLDKGINQRQLSTLANIPTTTISGWLNADRLPDYNAIIKLARFFNVSADYLLGLEDEDGTPSDSYQFDNTGNGTSLHHIETKTKTTTSQDLEDIQKKLTELQSTISKLIKKN